MDYQRIKRNVNYHSSCCKMYLRHDFKHCCAYCGLPEDIAFQIQTLGEAYYEKDHFRPQGLHEQDVHQYSNLFYACKKCNGIKDAKLLPLNPCEDDIYKGEHPNLDGGNKETHYMIKPLTAAGKEFVDLLQLNSRFRLEIRERTERILESRRRKSELYEKIIDSGKLSPELQEEIKSVCDIKDENSLQDLCGSSTFATQFIEAYTLLIAKGYPCKLLLEEQEIDIAVKINDIEYYGQVRIRPLPQNCKVKTGLLSGWKEHYEHCSIFEYIPDQSEMRIFKIDFNTIDWNKKEILLKDFQIL